jgi:hypothetical protein
VNRNSFIGAATSYPGGGVDEISDLFNNFPAPPQQVPLDFDYIDTKPLQKTQPARSALTAQFRAHPEVMKPQSFQVITPPSLHNIDAMFYPQSLPSTYNSPIGVPIFDKDQTASFVAMSWKDINNLTLSPDMNSPETERSHTITPAVDIPNGRRRHHRQPTISRSHSFAPYPGSSLSQHMSHFTSGCASAAPSSAMPRSPTTTSGFVSTGFTPLQVPAAQAILNHLRQHPNSAFPSSLITPDLVEVYEGRGWCLIGNCGIERANQKASPLYDPSAPDDSRKRVDHLYDHIRDKHFNCRPFLCTLWYVFSSSSL